MVNDLWFVISTPSNTKCAKKNKVINLWPRDLISEKGERQNMEVLSSKKVDHIRSAVCRNSLLTSAAGY